MPDRTSPVSSHVRIVNKLPSLSFLKTGSRHAAAKSTIKYWKPPAYRLIPLLLSVFIPLALLATLQVLLTHTQRHGGILFSPTADASDIAFSTSFLYLYLPTIVALLFGIFWSWIDLQVKRLEPWWQLSKEEGAKGEQSLLLGYPFDFMPLVPMSAVKNRHWAVFWASTAILLVTWFIVPLQAGIFTTQTITRNATASFLVSKNFIVGDKQNSTLTGRYIHSTHGIVWLNETLPSYMTRNYTLSPFRKKKEIDNGADEALKANETWSAVTTLYSLDMHCETPRENVTSVPSGDPSKPNSTAMIKRTQYLSSTGCSVDGSMLPVDGNDTVGDRQGPDIYRTKQFTAFYLGYYSTDASDYYLKGMCPPEANHTFMVLYTRNKENEADPPSNVTKLFCTPFYYQQDVVATIDAETRTPLNVTATGVKTQLPQAKYDSEFFEYQMNTGSIPAPARGALPLTFWPDPLEQLSTTQLSPMMGLTQLQAITGLAIGTTQRPLEDLLDPKILGQAYEAAYRIIFARSMVEILDQKFSKTDDVQGDVQFLTAAVVLVPVLTYIVQGLLGCVALCGIALMIISATRRWKLSSDPATIAAVMSMSAGNRGLLEDFARSTGAKNEFEWLKHRKFKLDGDERSNTIVDITPAVDANRVSRSSSINSGPPKAIRPREFRSFIVLPFISLLIVLIIVLGVLFIKSQPYGIARPSSKAIVRRLVENYIPTAIATMIEPVWILVNRLMCMLQPLEDLRAGKATARKSIDVDYSSLPPQLVVYKALRLGHFKLAAICLMALFANILAIAFAGLFEEQAILVPYEIDLFAPFDAKFVAINGTVGPKDTGIDPFSFMTMTTSGAYTGGSGTDQFLVGESNYTAGTPLPPWTDDRFLYVPFTNMTKIDDSTESLTAWTTAFGAALECEQIQMANYTIGVSFESGSHVSATLNLTVVMDDGAGNVVHCVKEDLVMQTQGWDLGVDVCVSGNLAMEISAQMQAPANSTTVDRSYCSDIALLGWTRHRGRVCSQSYWNETTTFNDNNTIFTACHPRLMVGNASVRVDREGHVQAVSLQDARSNPPKGVVGKHFSNSAANLFQQAGNYLFPNSQPTWHNDSFASDFMNYFMTKQHNDSRLVDPGLPLPTFDDVSERINPVYTKLFAIWLGVNKEKLLVAQDSAPGAKILGQRTVRQTRVVLSKPLFIIGEIILGTYVVTALCIYLWRPGRFLPRLPTSIAAIIMLFAGSSIVKDLEHASNVTARQRGRYLKVKGGTFSYGTYLNESGEMRAGVDKEPFVETIPVHGPLVRIQTGVLSLKRGGRS